MDAEPRFSGTKQWIDPNYHPDDMDGERTLYEHSEPGRKFSTVAALLVFVGLTVYVIAWAAPLWFLAIPAVGVVGLGWMVTFNPISGCRLDRRNFIFFSGSNRRALAVADIAKLRIIEWSDGAPSASVQMKDGSNHFVSSACFSGSDALCDAFARAGIDSSRD